MELSIASLLIHCFYVCRKFLYVWYGCLMFLYGCLRTACLSVCLSSCLSICLSVYLSVCLSVSMRRSVCLPAYLVKSWWRHPKTHVVFHRWIKIMIYIHFKLAIYAVVHAELCYSVDDPQERRQTSTNLKRTNWNQCEGVGGWWGEY